MTIKSNKRIHLTDLLIDSRDYILEHGEQASKYGL